MTTMTGRVEGKVAFITDATRGQGRSHAITLAREGADIIAVDICAQIGSVPYPMATPEDLAQTVKEVEALDRRIVATDVDVRDYDALKAALDDGVAQLGRPARDGGPGQHEPPGAGHVNRLPSDVNQSRFQRGDRTFAEGP
jgi:NAD(P)-dependent dehydrogenase (short-subunit alcohol dehydrogenase family)